MCVKNRVFALTYRFIFFCLGIVTLIWDLGFFDGNFKKGNLLYFTILSNILCAGVFFFLIIKNVIDINTKGVYGSSSISPHIKGNVMICILLTMCVYHFILIPYALKLNPYQTLKTSDIIFHYVIPFSMLLDWILFDEKRGFKWFDPLAWTGLPLLYVVFVFTQSRFEITARINSHISRYVYIFLDVGTLGIRSVMMNIVCLATAFVIAGYFIYGIDRIKLEM